MTEPKANQYAARPVHLLSPIVREQEDHQQQKGHRQHDTNGKYKRAVTHGMSHGRVRLPQAVFIPLSFALFFDLKKQTNPLRKLADIAPVPPQWRSGLASYRT